MKTFRNRAIAIRGATSMIALVTGMAVAPAAIAQTALAASTAQAPTDTTGSQGVSAGTTTVSTVQDPATPDTPENTNPEDIIVTGTRASLQSAIARKKNAGTVVDSIVADDIASFPDKNVGEALARVTGVQLSRDFGEGVAVSIRGVEPDLNRVEINGVSQQSAAGGRAGDFRELQVELVKSIDVYKGYTVDLTEGGIGGTVSIETRRPLDLVKPLFSVKVEGQYQELTDTLKPRLNLTAGRNDLFDGKLGFIVNVTHSSVDTRQDYASNTNWNRIADFDRSAEKTVANPAYANFGTYESCAGTTGTNATTATANRLACETQFFDWMPNIVRYRLLDRSDKRTSADLQLQYKFADNFNVFGQATVNNRIQQFRDANYSVELGSVSSAATSLNRLNTDAALAANGIGGASRPRVSAGTFTIDEETHTVTSVLTNRNGVNIGTVAAPNFAGANNIVSVQRRDFDFNSKSEYYQAGFNWEIGRTKVIGLATTSKATGINNTNLLAISAGVGGILIDRRNDAGLPVINFPESFDPANPADYANFTRRGADGQLLVQAGPTVQYRPFDQGNSEDQLKLDVDFDTSDLPFIKRIEYGGQYRTQNYFSYNGGGARLLTPARNAVPAAGIPAVPAVFQPTANVSYTTVIGSAPATGAAPNTYYLTQAQYQAFIAANATVSGGAPLFKDLAVTPDGAPTRIALPNFNYGALSSIYDLSGFDQDLVRTSGGLPQIPQYVIDEDIVAGYLKANFEQDFLGMTLTGNAGVRYIYTRDSGTSTNRQDVIRIRPGTGITLNGVVIPAVQETITVSVQQATLSNSYTDILPAVNFNLEVQPNLFVRGTYAKNLARPKVTDLSPAVTCTVDTGDFVAGDDTCTAGNPDLKPYRADQYDINVGWYPNRDTLISVGYFYKNINTFVLTPQVRNGVNLFGDGILYTVRQPINGQGAKLDGFEVSGQTAFTFLPSPLDGLGASANFTYSRALKTGLTNQATNLPLEQFPGLSKYTYNASVFYDKGFLNAKISYNKRTSWLQLAADANFANSPIYRRGEAFVDARVQFRLSPNFSIFAEGLNLAKEYSQTYIDDAKPVEYYYPGRRFFMGAQLKL